MIDCLLFVLEEVSERKSRSLLTVKVEAGAKVGERPEEGVGGRTEEGFFVFRKDGSRGSDVAVRVEEEGTSVDVQAGIVLGGKVLVGLKEGDDQVRTEREDVLRIRGVRNAAQSHEDGIIVAADDGDLFLWFLIKDIDDELLEQFGTKMLLCIGCAEALVPDAPGEVLSEISLF